jgi:hypothetical protein
MIFAGRLIAPQRRRSMAPVLGGVLAMLLVLSAACGGDDDGGKAPLLNQPNTTGAEVADEFLTLLQKKDVPGLQAFLSDAFIIQRADGSSSTKAEYLPNLPAIGPYEIADVKARQDGNTLVVHWTLSVQEVINGQTYKSTPAPRLSTFTWGEDRWRMVSHANFNAPQ